MKKSFLPAILVVLSVLFFTQCKKDDSSPATSTTNFSPLTAGTNWTYNYTEGSSAPKTFKLTVTNRDSVVNGKSYKVLSNSDGSTSYLAKVGSNYYRYASFPALGLNNFEELYLKDNKAVNETWDTATSVNYSSLAFPVNVKYTIKGKGESRTVSGKSFTNVTHVRLDISVSGLGSVGGGDFYYQEGVGLIEDSILVTPPLQPQYTSTEQLTAYEIK